MEELALPLCVQSSLCSMCCVDDEIVENMGRAFGRTVMRLLNVLFEISNCVMEMPRV